MRLTLLVWSRKFAKQGKFRQPMAGRKIGREKSVKYWSLSLGELDEETIIDDRTVPVREKVPVIMVPDLKNFELKPYVTYRAEKVHEPPTESKDLFDMVYAPKIEAEFKAHSDQKVPEPKESRLITPVTNYISSVFSKKSG